MSSSGSPSSFDAAVLRDRFRASFDELSVRRWRAVGVVLVIAILVGGWLTHTLLGSDSPPPPSSSATAATSGIEDALPRVGATPPPSASPDDGGVRTTAPSPARVVVQVAGAVANPGVYDVGESARVNEVLQQAGGATAEADLDRLNLAAKVVDGQRIYVVRKGETAPLVDGGDAPSPAASSSAAGSATATASAIVDLNTATLAELDGLPGVGPSTAQAILDYRTQHGHFASINDLNKVKGIGEAKFAQLKSHVKV